MEANEAKNPTIPKEADAMKLGQSKRDQNSPTKSPGAPPKSLDQFYSPYSNAPYTHKSTKRKQRLDFERSQQDLLAEDREFVDQLLDKTMKTYNRARFLQSSTE